MLMHLLLLFSHLADAFIQSDLQIRKSNYNYKLKLYKYYIYTFKKIEKLNKMTNALQQHFKTKHLNKYKIKLKTIQNIKTIKGMSIIMILT